MNQIKIYDVVIIGGGPAGYTAALYSARAGFDTLVLEKISAGGQLALTSLIENYPGFEDGINGFELSEKMQNQAHRFGSKTKYDEVISLNLLENPKIIKTLEEVIYSKTVIISTGAVPRKLGLAHEDELIGKGITYCASCDGMFYRGKNVVVVGGGNTAVLDALLLSRVANSVTLIHRRDTLRATKIYHNALNNSDNISIYWNTIITELLYDKKISGVKIKNIHSNEISTLSCDGVFVSIGREPASKLVTGQLNLDENGYIIADETTMTNIPGVFAIGDVRTKKVRQVVTAVSDGAAAIHEVEQYLA